MKKNVENVMFVMREREYSIKEDQQLKAVMVNRIFFKKPVIPVEIEVTEQIHVGVTYDFICLMYQ